MVKAELVKRSPLRILENSINGGVGKGNIAAIASKKGIGKTACLVHIATDNLFRGKHVIHVSFSTKVDHIINWYEDIFKEISKKRDLESAVQIHDEIIKNRVIMNFNQNAVSTEQMINSLKAMIGAGKFNAETIIVDGYDFSLAKPEDIQQLKEFAQEKNLEVWFSASLKKEKPLYDEKGFPYELENFLESISVLITLTAQKGYVALNLLKDHNRDNYEDTNLKLDPKTLLIAED